MAVVPALPHSESQPIARRRNSTSASILLTKPSFADHHSPSAISSSSDDLELITMKSADHRYSSLRDLLPSIAVRGSDIGIRNRLVKQAARAYLRPMSTAADYGGGSFLRRLWTPVAGLVDFWCRNVVRALNGTIRVVRSRIHVVKIQRLSLSLLKKTAQRYLLETTSQKIQRFESSRLTSQTHKQPYKKLQSPTKGDENFQQNQATTNQYEN